MSSTILEQQFVWHFHNTLKETHNDFDDGPSRSFFLSLGFCYPVGAGMSARHFVVGFAVRVGAALLVTAGARSTLEVVAKSASLQIGLDVCNFLGLPAIVDSLCPLPCFDAKEEENGFNEDNAPFPANTRVFEHNCVEPRDVDDREHGNETRNNSPEQELIAPDVNHPLRKVTLALGLHAEEGSAHIDHFPGEEECKPSQARESGGTGTKDHLTLSRVLIVAVVAKIIRAITKAIEDKDEGRKAEGGHPDTVHDHVDQKFGCEDTLLQLLSC